MRSGADQKPLASEDGINVALSVGRMGTTEGMRGMLLTANIHPSSASSMQDAANKVGEKISRVNRRSMRDIKKRIKSVDSQLTQQSELRGMPDTTIQCSVPWEKPRYRQGSK